MWQLALTLWDLWDMINWSLKEIESNKQVRIEYFENICFKLYFLDPKSRSAPSIKVDSCSNMVECGGVITLMGIDGCYSFFINNTYQRTILQTKSE